MADEKTVSALAYIRGPLERQPKLVFLPGARGAFCKFRVNKIYILAEKKLAEEVSSYPSRSWIKVLAAIVPTEWKTKHGLDRSEFRLVAREIERVGDG